MISLQLRATAPQNRMQMLRLIVEQLQGIGGSRSLGMGPNRVMSLPDAVAGALMKQYLPEEKAKYDKLIRFAERLQQLRESMAEHIALDGLPPERVAAIAVRLINLGWFRVGTDRYAKASRTFGITTIMVEMWTRATATSAGRICARRAARSR